MVMGLGSYGLGPWELDLGLGFVGLTGLVWQNGGGGEEREIVCPAYRSGKLESFCNMTGLTMLDDRKSQSLVGLSESLLRCESVGYEWIGPMVDLFMMGRA